MKITSARLAHWLRMPGWRGNEGAALALGLDPDDTKAAKFPNRESEQEHADLMSLLLRAKNMEQIEFPIPPHQFVAWLKANKIAVDVELDEKLSAQQVIKDWKKEFENLEKSNAALKKRNRALRKKLERENSIDDLSSRELTSLYRMLLGMATAKYAFNNSNLSPFQKYLNISTSFDPKYKLNEDTVKKWFERACEHLRE